ncbi:hypothetical protein BBK82_43195 [Lentzea guizhouensis]|uniref:AraC-type transcription regulator ligand-binding domain-containing protein n=1 Tax=Lentzea guizhouensis TaxID=1586287 RepID=A0A1B2HVM2_9PSEU|nr:cupin domain-containing protein [Lentzea guizhouensis]ANZ41748.1 hypothetical protein BBK82_43195 [Lentzea guizhouensis]
MTAAGNRHERHVKATDPRSTLLAHVTDLLSNEVETNAVGRSLVLDHLARILFVHVLRAHAEQTDRPAGWRGALNDNVFSPLRVTKASA